MKWSNCVEAYLLVGLIACSVGDALGQTISWPQVHPHVRIRTSASTAPGYSPQQIRKAYKIDQIRETGKGQTIALINAYGNPNALADLKIFSNHFNLPAPDLQIVYPQGQPALIDPLWALEVSLDLEWAHAIAPRAKLMLVVAKTSSYEDLLEAVDYAVAHGATQVSMSWGSVEFAAQTGFDTHFISSTAMFFVASGDQGSMTQYPASSPYVTAVGGSRLILDSSGNVVTETGWQNSGGGISLYESRPSFQAFVQSTGFRTVPDVSYSADPEYGFAVYNSYGFGGQVGWMVVAGTSAGAPQWAALAALGSAQRQAHLSSFNEGLYYLKQQPTSASYYFDVLTGCSGADLILDCAQTGYDLVTGLGTPISSNLLKALYLSGL